ncbi:MAG: hypothetical protein ACPLXC_01790 [Candidatus Pacearchaeota archaeon]
MKLLRKIAPLAVMTILCGATVAAADLASWKASFPGTDTAIVVGAGAAAQDTLGAVHIANALGVSGGGEAPVEGAALITAPGNVLNYGESFANVAGSLADDDLPTLLAEGRYRETRGAKENDVSYAQKLVFTAGTDNILFDRKDTGDEEADTYLYLDDDLTAPAYTYELKFDKSVKFDPTEAKKDFEMSKLNMLGRDYYIVDATADVGVTDEITDMVLMGGALKASQWEYSKATYTLAGKTYEVEAKIISDTALTVVLVINGEETDALEEGRLYTLEDGTRVGILDIIPNEGAEKSTGTAEGNDLVTFYLGAEKIELIEGKDIEINGERVKYSNVDFTGGAGELDEIEVTFAPKNTAYVATGEAWTDPVLGRFKYTFQGLEKKTETITSTVSGDDGKFTFKNLNKKEVEIPIIADANSEVWFGDRLSGAGVDITQDGVNKADIGMFALIDGDACYDNAGTNPTLCKRTKFLVVSSTGEAHLFELTGLYAGADTIWGSADDTIDIYDITAGRDFEDLVPAGGVFTVDVRFMADPIVLTQLTGAGTTGLEFTNINFYGTGAGHGGGTSGTALFDTSGDGEVDIGLIDANGDGLKDTYFNFNESDDGNYLGGWYATDLDCDGDITLESPVGWAGLDWLPETRGSDVKKAIDIADMDGALTGDQAWGAIFTLWSDNNDKIQIDYPEERVAAKVYVSEILTTIPELGTGGAAGAATPVLDTDVNDVKDMNLIVVGGSAINRVAAEMLDVTFPTYGSDEAWQNATKVDMAGKAIIKLMDSPYTTGKFAMLVAGWEGVDTERAAKALKEGTPAISGQSVLLNTATSTVTVITA